MIINNIKKAKIVLTENQIVEIREKLASLKEEASKQEFSNTDKMFTLVSKIRMNELLLGDSKIERLNVDKIDNVSV